MLGIFGGGKGFIIATPFIVRAVSGNIVMPALTSGMPNEATVSMTVAAN